MHLSPTSKLGYLSFKEQHKITISHLGFHKITIIKLIAYEVFIALRF